MGKNVICVPTNVSQKCHWPRRSLYIFPVIFGNQ